MRSRLALIVAVLWSVYTLAYLCDVFFYLNVVIYSLTHRAISACLICVLVILLIPARKQDAPDRIEWYDVLVIAIIVAGCSYVAVNANHLVAEGRLTAYPYEMLLAGLLFASVIEATRRTTGWVLAGLVGFFFFYGVYSDHFPGFLHSTGFPYSMAFGWMYLSGQGVWGLIIGVVTTIVSGFIIFGAFLKAVGASQFFNDLALSSAGFMRGGGRESGGCGQYLFRNHIRFHRGQCGHHRANHHSINEKDGIRKKLCRCGRGHGVHGWDVHAAGHGRGRLSHS